MSVRLTVLTAIYRDERYVREAVLSVLGQTYSDFEYIIVDDHVVDGSREVVEQIRDPRIRILRTEQNSGHGGALNFGLLFARGEYVARLDADDVCVDARRFEKQIAYLDAHPDVAVVGSQAGYIDAGGRRLKAGEIYRPTTATGVEWTLMLGCPIVHSTAMYRTRVVRDEMGGYVPGVRFGEDADLWLRIARHYAIRNLPDRLVDYRVLPTSLTRNMSPDLRRGQREIVLTGYREAMERILRMTVPADWIAAYADIHMPEVTPDPAAAGRWPAIEESIYRRFVELRPDAATDRAVREWRSLTLANASFVAMRARPMFSFRTLVRAVLIHPRSAPLLFTKWFLALALGPQCMVRLQRWRLGSPFRKR
jgi:hypothetical protein